MHAPVEHAGDQRAHGLEDVFLGGIGSEDPVELEASLHHFILGIAAAHAFALFCPECSCVECARAEGGGVTIGCKTQETVRPILFGSFKLVVTRLVMLLSSDLNFSAFFFFFLVIL